MSPLPKLISQYKLGIIGTHGPGTTRQLTFRFLQHLVIKLSEPGTRRDRGRKRTTRGNANQCQEVAYAIVYGHISLCVPQREIYPQELPDAVTEFGNQPQ